MTEGKERERKRDEDNHESSCHMSQPMRGVLSSHHPYMMIPMLTLTCRQSLSFLSISTTISHCNVHHSFYCNLSIIQCCQPNPYVHLYSFCLCVCVWADAICVRLCVVDKKWKRHWEIQWWGQGQGWIFIVGYAFTIKTEFHCQVSIPLYMRRTLGPHLAPVGWKKPLQKHAFNYSILPLTENIFLRIFQMGKIKMPTAYWAGSILKVREENNLNSSLNRTNC